MNTKYKVVKVGIMPLKDYKKRTIAIAKGEHKPHKGEPKLWFPSIKSFANVLSEQNQALLRLIVDLEPKSISELETPTGRKANNLLRTLRTLENYGFVKLEEGQGRQGRAPLIPKVLYNKADVEISFGVTA